MEHIPCHLVSFSKTQQRGKCKKSRLMREVAHGLKSFLS